MELPRVTEILNYYTAWDKVPRDILANATVRGTRVHSICAGIAKGAWITDAMIEPDYLGYVNSFRQWHEAQVQEYQIIEKRFFHESEGFTGQVDFVIKGTDDKIYLADLKTSATKQKTYPVQMAAYKSLLALSGVDVYATMLVYLDKEGAFPDIDVLEDLTEEYSVFMSALECYKFFNKRKRKKKA